MTRLWIDSETYNDQPINVGSHRYAETVEVMLYQYAVDDGPVTVLDFTAGQRVPAELREALDDPAIEVWGQNAGMFDRVVLNHARPDLAVPLERWRDSMVQAYMHSLPGSLEKLCAVLRVPVDQAKDKAGKELIRLFCMPRPKNRSCAARRARRTPPSGRFKSLRRPGHRGDA
jgi:DNA polymerase